MAQPLQNINIAAPAFKGLNTQDSPLSGDPQYASVADNVIIDNFGRIGSRKGLEALTDNPSVLNGQKLTVIHEYEDANGNLEIISIGNGKIFKGETTLVDITPTGYIITDENFSIVNFNDKCYLFNKNHDALVYETTAGLQLMSDTTEYSGTAPRGSAVLAGFGRLWVTDCCNYPNTILWSDLLIGEAWDTGSSGSIDLDKVWPDGSDKITGLAMWNNYLVIFGYNSIVLYQNADSPANMSLVDTITGVGCVARDSIQSTGTDLMFLSLRGVMTLGRTVQEKSNPINDISKNVRDDLLRLWSAEEDRVRSVYSPINAFYLLVFPTSNVVYAFDIRGALENGALRVTRWITEKHYSFCVRQDDTLLVGNILGVNTYSGYLDNDETYLVRYYSNPLSFGNPSGIKFLKKITPTIIGGSGLDVEVKWSYDFFNDYKTQNIRITSDIEAYFGESEFNTNSQYTSGKNLISAKRINASGSGNLVTVGVETNINGASMSLQEFNLQATLGRIY